MERLYTDVYGESHPKSDINCHHVFFRRTAKGRGGNVRQFINQRGLVLPMLKGVHVELHNTVDAPVLPSTSLMFRLNQSFGHMDEANPYARFVDMAEYISALSHRCPNSDHRYQAGQIAENLAQQAPFILAGQIHITPIEEAA